MTKSTFINKIKDNLRVRLLLGLYVLLCHIVFANPPQEPSRNYYNIQIHPLMYVDYFGDFTNMPVGKVKNGGHVSYYGNVENMGEYVHNNSGEEHFLGTKPQLITGNKELLTYDFSLENAQGLTLENEVKVANSFKFVKGIVSTDRKILNYHLHFLQKTTCKGENDAAHVDGYVSKTGNEPFSFPIGNGQEIHRLDISAPNNINQKIAATFLSKTPFDFNKLAINVEKINATEYWIMQGLVSVNVTLHWRKSSKIKDLAANLNQLRVVGYKNGQWQNLGNIAVKGNIDEGEITSSAIIVGEYEQITIGIEKNPSNVIVRVAPKVILQGPYDIASGLMYDSIRISGSLPYIEPYSSLSGFSHKNGGGGNNLGANVININGPNAIVDWVFVSLRAFDDSTNIIATKSALLQRDGDIVEAADGTSELIFNVPIGRYFVAVQHRNHLGVMASFAPYLTAASTIVDFRTQSTKTYGNYAQKLMPNGRNVLWAGNTNLDRRIVYVGTGTDYSNISAKVLSAPANTPAYSKSYVVKGYHLEDVDMNAKVIYVGTGTDQTLISQNVLLHPENVSFSKSKPIQEQIPQ